MAVSDLEAFIRERLSIFDPSIDASAGSPVDTEVIQPLLRRLGSDPFTVDFLQFAQDRLQQEFPELATKEGDAIADLLLKPATLLLDPVIREAVRLKNAQSFKDPSILTLDEADALAANLFAQRSTGEFSRGQSRIYFAAPQSVSLSPANFVTSKGGLHFFPTAVQSIRTDEMLYNTEGTLYYFDINTIAEAAGDQYNIGPDELVSIANLTSAVRVTNKRRFRFGAPAETAVEFIGRAQQELSEKSLVTERGARSKITTAFSEVTQVAVVGFGDPDMKRDVIEGGGLGPILASGFALTPVSDGENATSSRRVYVDVGDTIDFTAVLGLEGDPGSYVLTLYGGFSAVPQVRDVVVKEVIDLRTLDLEDQVLDYSTPLELPWSLRKKELTLSGIPGGILFPDTEAGTVAVADGQVHIGGATDLFIRATDFDTSAIVLDSVVDDEPLLSGNALTSLGSGEVSLTDLVFDTSYSLNDATYLALQKAALKGFSLQILDGPAAGSYRVITVTHVSGDPPLLLVDPQPDDPLGDFRWRLLDTLDVNLAEPKETKISGTDMSTTQNDDFVQTAGGVDFQEYGVGADDVLRIEDGPDAGDFIIKQVLTPLYQRIQLDRALTSTRANLTYTIFRSNAEGGVTLPLVRITSIDLLDTSGQSTGTKIPYAKPVDGRSRNFANVAHGVKEDLTDGILGFVGDKQTAGITCSGLTLTLNHKSSATATPAVTSVLFTGIDPLTAADVASQINTAYGQRIAGVVDDDRVGIIPFTYSVWTDTDAAVLAIFGTAETYSTADVRSPTIDLLALKWASLSPIVDPNYDVVEVLDGYQVGFYASLTVPYADNSAAVSEGASFLPEVGRHIRVGSRSLGVARLFFLEPTSIEFDDNSRFAAELPDGTVLNYLTDKTLDYQIVPALPNDTVPKDAVVTTASNLLSSASAEFYKEGVLAGDTLEMTYQPITTGLALADPVLLLTHTTIILSVGGGVDKSIIFVNDDPLAGAANVSRKGVADQINRQVGQKICSITSGDELEFDADVSVIVRKTGTSNTLLGFSTSSDTNNASSVAGEYSVASFTDTTITIDGVFAGIGVFSRQHFKVFRPGLQRTVSTVMSTQVETAGLYYCDVELISEGAGDQYNIDADVRMTATGFVSDGYWLTTEDPNLTFSPVERPVLHISRSILDVGVSDSPVNATQISGQNLQINYERSSLTSSVQNFASSEEERVLCQSPLVRHLIPYFVRFDAQYIGGSKEDVVIPDVEKFITELAPQEFFEVSDLTRIIQNKGATSVKNPIDLIAVIHPFDRDVFVERSQDKINTGKLAAFVPDALNIVRKLS
jgi:hypothetical protein